MSQGDNTPGISKLAGAMQKIANLGSDNSLVADYGVVNKDGSLTTNTFKVAIPQADYMVCQRLTGNSKLKPGQRVLVVWVQNDAVVVDRITHANRA